MARSPKPPLPPPQPPPRAYGARGIAALLAPIVRPAFQRRAPAAAAILADWDSLAGPDFATRASPQKFAGGTLTLACTGPAAMELQHLAPQLISRLNLALGQHMVERLRFVQQTPVFRAAPPPREPTAAVTPPENLPPGAVGEALAKLYQSLKSRP
jgi:hypothetical protein